MRLVEFLIHLLTAQAQTLERLAVLFGEAELLEMLETAGESFDHDPPSVVIDRNWFEKELTPSQKERGNPHQELEGSVSELNLPPVFEFHLWSYPFYRKLIESSIHLNAKICIQKERFSHQLVNETVKQAKEWIERLPIAPEHSLRAEKMALIPWLKFRSKVLKKMGRRPLVPLN